MRRTSSLRGVVAFVAAGLAWSLPLSAPAQEIIVQPYVQPGDGRFLTGSDVKVVSWLTNQYPGEFVVEFQTPGGQMQTAKPKRVTLDFPVYVPPKKKGKEAKDKVDPKNDTGEKKEEKVPPPPEKEHHYFKYTAYLDSLPFNSDIRYRVKLGDRVIREATFRTRATADKTARCVLVGDMAQGRKNQQPVAYQIGKQKPDFLVALGDIVYQSGRVNEYMHFFWDTYNNVKEAGPTTGAPLMASVPFYPVLGNHDVNAKLPAVPDALAAYYFYCPPKGGPGMGPWITPLGKDEDVAAKFRALTKDSYPNMDAYSFDYGPAHFVVLNDNAPMDLAAPTYRKWLTDDLKTTKAKWKFVCYHIPGFHSSITHYTDQQIRPLQPLFEECGVDIAFGGHVHNYQRTVPFKFAPEPDQPKKGPVNGRFTLDTAFDGVKNTKPKGVIHIVAGGGGAGLYGPGLEKTAPVLKTKYAASYADFTAKMVVDQHSFVVLDFGPDQLTLRALNPLGKELDSITITK